jgi:PhnB protein
MSFPRPEGHHAITPGASVPNAGAVIEFMERAFGGKVVERYQGPGGAVMHAEVMVGDSVVMLGEPMPDDQPMPASLSLYVDDAEAVDATYQQALEAGAVSLTEPANQFYGYRSATVRDGSGNRWTICTVVEDLTPGEINKRMAAMMGGDS